jgi:hypothetical protein
MITMAKVNYTAKTLADEVGTTPKALRVFLRTADSGVESVGKGGRYSIEMTATQLAKFKKNYAAFEAAKAEAKAAREAELAAAKAAHPVSQGESSPVETELDFTEVDEEPTAADLTDDEFADMIAEIEAEGDEVEA